MTIHETPEEQALRIEHKALNALPEVLRELATVNPYATHYDGCWRQHGSCAMRQAADRIEELERSLRSAPDKIYRRCSECGTEWSAKALVAAHNEILDEIGKPWAADHVTDPAAVHCCPDCIHDW